MNWQDTKEAHTLVHQTYCDLVNAEPKLKEYRDFIEQNAFGFGERSFIWMWKLICEQQPDNFSFLEVGVFRGQILALIDMLRPDAVRYGVTPLDSTDGHWESNYEKDIETLHERFNLKQNYVIFKGLSTHPEIIQAASRQQYDIVYIDGGHAYEVVQQDLQNYMPLVKVGGLLVIDDCCNDLQIPYGMFGGIESVTKAVKEVLPNNEFEFLYSVVHNKVFKRI